jgi:anti-sigma factor RsiW
MTTHDESLHWLAQRYVLGELSDAEAAAFEACLADDEQAAAAVADAARLVMAVRAAVQPQRPTVTPADRQRPAGMPRAGRLVIGLASLAAAVAIVAVLPRMGDNAAAGRTAELAERWAEIAEATAAEDLTDDEDATAADEVPDWLLAAVTLEQARTVREN